MLDKIKKDSAVILCSHVANGAPILLAIRTEPAFEYDSGWQVLCNCHEENWKDAKIYSISEVLDLEPSLEDFIELPPDITIVRDDILSEWKII